MNEPNKLENGSWAEWRRLVLSELNRLDGDISELQVATHYLQNGYEVFRNVCSTGLIDLVVVCTKTKQVFGFHTDFPWNYKWNTAIFYINTNNGKTLFKHNKQISSRENRVAIFDGRLKHTGTTCTDAKNRIVINLNYFN